MKNAIEAWKARYKLDEYLRRLHRLTHMRPERIWIRDVREALGLSAAELAKRMGIRQSALSALERSEGRGAIGLKSLRRAAQAMDCRLVYALVPNSGSLERGMSWRQMRERLHQRKAEYAAARERAREELRSRPPVRPRSAAEIIAAAFAWATEEPPAPEVPEPHVAEKEQIDPDKLPWDKLSTQELLQVVRGERPAPQAEEGDDIRPPGYAQDRGDPE